MKGCSAKKPKALSRRSFSLKGDFRTRTIPPRLKSQSSLVSSTSSLSALNPTPLTSRLRAFRFGSSPSKVSISLSFTTPNLGVNVPIPSSVTDCLSIEQSIKRKIEAVGTPLKDWDIQINYDIKTGFNDAFIISTEKRNEILDYCFSHKERIRTAELIRPVLRGKDIKRYGCEWADKYLIATFSSRHYDIEQMFRVSIIMKGYTPSGIVRRR